MDKTWIVSGMSPIQVNLINKHPEDQPIIVEAGGRVWLRSRHVHYFVLKSQPQPDRRPPEEDIDGNNFFLDCHISETKRDRGKF